MVLKVRFGGVDVVIDSLGGGELTASEPGTFGTSESTANLSNF